jgi:DNA polymerase III alpha subunit (gram-positive type)
MFRRSSRSSLDGARILQQGNDCKNVVEILDLPPPPVQVPIVQASLMDWEKVIYVVFDLETTGRSRQQDEVIKLAAVVLDWMGVEIEEAFFSELVKLLRQIPPHITTFTSITNDMVNTAKPFPVVAGNFSCFIKEHADEQGGISEIILVGHNAKVFDIPWLMHQLSVHGIISILLGNGRFNYGMDTLVIAKTAIRNNKKVALLLPTTFPHYSNL